MFSALARRLDEVHDDDDVGAEVAGDIHRDVAHQPAIREHRVIQEHRSERSGYGHAGAHRGGKVPVIQHHHLSRDHVGRDGAIRNRKLVEIRLRTGLGHKAAQEILDAAGVHQARWHHHVAVLDAEVQRIAVGDSLALLLDGLQVALSQATDHGLPVDCRSRKVVMSALEIPDA